MLHALFQLRLNAINPAKTPLFAQNNGKMLVESAVAPLRIRPGFAAEVQRCWRQPSWRVGHTWSNPILLHRGLTRERSRATFPRQSQDVLPSTASRVWIDYECWSRPKSR